MILKWIRAINLHFNPPKKGDVYYGDALDFVVCSNLEHVLHRMTTIEGETIWDVVPSDDTYRLTIEMDSQPYYKCKGEVLAQNRRGYGKEWLTRVQPRRILKETFKKMILDGRIKKYDE